MKRKTAALYDPYLDVMGGGERHILSILQVLEHEGYNVSVFWDNNLTSEIKSRLNIGFRNLSFLPNVFGFPSPFEKFETLSTYDIFLYVTDGSYFFSSAKNNFVFSMVPDKKLYRMDFMNRLKTRNFRFIANSRFTKSWLESWGIKSDVVYPYIDQRLVLSDIENPLKQKTVLSVGRFFPHLHAKKQEVILEVFESFHEKHPEYRLVMAGGLKGEDTDYFRMLEKKVKDKEYITLKANVSYEELLDLYQTSEFFWHFAGYGIDEKVHPERVEHLGMTPLEAMATGAVTFCYGAGGPKEIITDGKNGFLFQSEDELISKTEKVINDNGLYKKVQAEAKQTIRETFTYDIFKTKVINTLLKKL